MARTKPTLVQTLTAKADELDTAGAKASAASAALAAQAAEQANIAETAKVHAAAVDAAVDILIQAGVTL